MPTKYQRLVEGERKAGRQQWRLIAFFSLILLALGLYYLYLLDHPLWQIITLHF